MIPLIDEKRDELVALCRQYHVRQLELFGSAATGEFDAGRSDLDFLVVFDRPEGTNAFHQYFGLLNSLAKLYQRKVDLVCANAMRNPYFIRSVGATRQVVYAA
jgi:uncharacterized protein